MLKTNSNFLQVVECCLLLYPYCLKPIASYYCCSKFRDSYVFLGIKLLFDLFKGTKSPHNIFFSEKTIAALLWIQCLNFLRVLIYIYWMALYLSNT